MNINKYDEDAEPDSVKHFMFGIIDKKFPDGVFNIIFKHGNHPIEISCPRGYIHILNEQKIIIHGKNNKYICLNRTDPPGI